MKVFEERSSTNKSKIDRENVWGVFLLLLWIVVGVSCTALVTDHNKIKNLQQMKSHHLSAGKVERHATAFYSLSQQNDFFNLDSRIVDLVNKNTVIKNVGWLISDSII